MSISSYTSIFSHTWEGFVKKARKDSNWSHEKSSIDMLDYIIEQNNLRPIFERNGLTEEDITFVKVTTNIS